MGAQATNRYEAPDANVRRVVGKDLEEVAKSMLTRHHHSSSLPPSAGLRSSTVSPIIRGSWLFGPHDAPAISSLSISDAIASTDRAAADRIGYNDCLPPPPGVEPDPLKEFCTFWIRTGECDYTQQGCFYKHEMSDRTRLTELGSREVPRWWKEKISIRVGSSTPRPMIRDPS
jgi:hypothetical protein